MAPGRVLVETPAYMVDTWNAEMLTNPKSGVGISGTHTALLAVAERFAASGWETYLLGPFLSQALQLLRAESTTCPSPT